MLPGAVDAPTRPWAVATGGQVHRFNHSNSVNSVVFVKGAKTIPTAGLDTTPRTRGASTGEEIVRLTSFNSGGQ